MESAGAQLVGAAVVALLASVVALLASFYALSVLVVAVAIAPLKNGLAGH